MIYGTRTCGTPSPSASRSWDRYILFRPNLGRGGRNSSYLPLWDLSAVHNTESYLTSLPFNQSGYRGPELRGWLEPSMVVEGAMEEEFRDAAEEGLGGIMEKKPSAWSFGMVIRPSSANRAFLKFSSSSHLSTLYLEMRPRNINPDTSKYKYLPAIDLNSSLISPSLLPLTRLLPVCT
ncbi:hypothetical protein L211DRAFT_680998 [Terfezia boudieri ATCC MYA-4762]|uniref:Uncharacterized protein n=1 Tax=Terfezia boudieri ATCC MYA-4762 TaxID=1051890 RepID=A0A3N4LUG5_9PEZI|nr:hypothetical protein L211DRAFT_680998 [Terfezia boudieri ATCC MYA-4762]